MTENTKNKTETASAPDNAQYGNLGHQIETGIYDPANATIEIKVGNDLGFHGRSVETVEITRAQDGWKSRNYRHILRP